MPLLLDGTLGVPVTTVTGTLPLANGGTGVTTGQLAGLRNRIINGQFNINQRVVSGTVTLTASSYGHDRFKAGASGCTYTFAASQNGNVLTISAGTLQQVIEGANLEGGAMTLSWFGTTTGRIDSGSYSASGVAGTAVAGTNQTVEFGTGTLGRVQYELGTAATTFEQRPIGMELALCQRYYCRFGGSNTIDWYGLGSNDQSTTAAPLISFPVTMRANPTALEQSGTATDYNVKHAATTTACSAVPTFIGGGTNGSLLRFTVASGLTLGQAGYVRPANANAYLGFSTEL